MKRLIRVLSPLLVLLAGVAVGVSLIATGPEASRQRPQTPPPAVEVMVVEPQDYQVRIASRGTVSPRTESTLVAETAGRVIAVSDQFRTGGFFEKGEVLLRLDDRDYRNAITIAAAEVAQRQLALAEEQARGDQARRDWTQLRLETEPTPLVLRTPQLEHAKAALAAAQARLQQAQLNLERTRIVAPYAGRILQKDVDLGQFVTTGSRLALIYASDAVEVRLPLSDEQMRYLTLPETFRDQPEVPEAAQARVTFSTRIAGERFSWQGRLVRTEGSVDTGSRQLFVVARIDDPYRRQEGRPPLKIGQFVEARIFGVTLSAVYTIPRQAIHGEDTVHIITPDNHLERRRLDILWRDSEDLVAAGPLAPGERIALTRLPFAADGIVVRVVNAEGHTEGGAAEQAP